MLRYFYYNKSMVSLLKNKTLVTWAIFIYKIYVYKIKYEMFCFWRICILVLGKIQKLCLL